MNVRLRPMRAISPRRSTVIVAAELTGTSASVVTGSAAGVWLCARVLAAIAVSAAPVMRARRPTFGDLFCMAGPRMHDLVVQGREDLILKASFSHSSIFAGAFVSADLSAHALFRDRRRTLGGPLRNTRWTNGAQNQPLTDHSSGSSIAQEFGQYEECNRLTELDTRGTTRKNRRVGRHDGRAWYDPRGELH